MECNSLLNGFQHFAILLKYVIHVAIPDIPNWVADEMAKLEYQRREALKVAQRMMSIKNNQIYLMYRYAFFS